MKRLIILTFFFAFTFNLLAQQADTTLVKDSGLKKVGASGVLKVGANGVQAIFGAKAQFICNDLKEMTGI